MVGPIGPRGFNGSQGPLGPMRSVGPAGPNGTGFLSTCQYGNTSKTEETTGFTLVRLKEPHVSMRRSKPSCMLPVYVSKPTYLRATNGLSYWAGKHTHA